MSKCVNCGSEILTGDIHWEMGLCNNCYNELYKDHKTHISLDKMWLEFAQSFRDENEKLQDKITDLQHRLEVAEKALELACSHIPCKCCPNSNGAGICYIAQDIGYYQPKQKCNEDNSYYFKLKAEKELKGE